MVSPLPGNQGRENGGDRHQHRNSDPVGAAERIRRAEHDDSAERAGREQPVHDRHVDLSFIVAGGVQHAHARQETQLDRLLR
jgi:hypothetical protein